MKPEIAIAVENRTTVSRLLTKWFIEPFGAILNENTKTAKMVTGAYLIFLSLLMVLFIPLTLPPTIDYIVSDRYFHFFYSFLKHNQETLKRWCPSLRLGFEIITAVFIAGSVFAELIVKGIKEKIKAIELEHVAKVTERASNLNDFFGSKKMR